MIIFDLVPDLVHKLTDLVHFFGSAADFIYTELGEVEWCAFIYTNFSGGYMVKKSYKKKGYILLLVKTLSRCAG